MKVEALRMALEAKAATKKLSEAEEHAAMLLMMASEESDLMTGAVRLSGMGGGLTAGMSREYEAKIAALEAGALALASRSGAKG
jgi:hypothetical protein